jgi:hypothetical protein
MEPVTIYLLIAFFVFLLMNAVVIWAILKNT